MTVSNAAAERPFSLALQLEQASDAARLAAGPIVCELKIPKLLGEKDEIIQDYAWQ